MAAPLADIGNYLNSNPFKAWRTGDGGFDEVQFNSYNSVNGIPLYKKNESGQWEINPESRLGELNKKYPGLNFRLENDPYTEDYEDGRPSFQLKWNPEALPKDKFGNYGTSVGVEGYENGKLGNLRRPELVYDDPNYGRITDKRNLMQRQNFMDKFGRVLTKTPLLLTLVTAGLGSALGGAGLLGAGLKPSTLLSLGQGGRGAIGGDYGRLLQTIVSAGLPMTGLSGAGLSAARMGSGFFSNMLNNRGGRR